MKHCVKLLLLLLLTEPCVIGQELSSESSPPKIIRTIPEFGDCNVDPGISEIQIFFDQDMSTGMSVVNTPFMPQTNGKVQWADERTIVIPVVLRPNSPYSLAFNSLKYTNFQSKNGVPLNPDELYFITKSVNTRIQNKEAYQELFQYFPAYYSYSVYKGIDWHSEFMNSQDDLENTNTPLEFAVKLIGILKKADDPHLWIEVDGQRFETGKVKITEKNYGSAQIFSALQNKKVADGFSAIAGNYDSIGFISISSWNKELDMLSFKAWGKSSNPIIPTPEVLDELLTFPSLVIDVRENRGGNEGIARKFASMFTHDSIPYEKVNYYNDETGQFDNEHIKWLHPNNEGLLYSGNVFVLTGPSVMSSNESFLLMMKQLQNVQLVGMKSYGSTANPKPVTLANGVKIYIPSWQAFTLDGNLIEGKGIKPDIEIITRQEQYTRETDVLFQEVLNIIDSR